ncbi:MAG TPA: TonB-dependent receptor [Anaeromyxobacteraceae bacterium]|nr:TonB-dependent receptor [Anaeromyxobacteraceae bacterium]
MSDFTRASLVAAALLAAAAPGASGAQEPAAPAGPAQTAPQAGGVEAAPQPARPETAPRPAAEAEAGPAQPSPAAPEAAAAARGAELGEDIVVTATRSPRPARDLPADVTVMTREEIERNPGKVVDELLRPLPEFSTFRRSSSVAADPTSSGVSLRGVGPSAASRSLVLRDGVPANDAFKDNIWWRAMPPLGIQRIEVVPGGGSALYGNYALAGVTQVISRPITQSTVDGLAEYGSFNTGRLSAWGSDRWGPVGGALEADLFDTDGYYVVAPYARGPVDTPAPSKHAVGSGRLEAEAARDLLLTAGGSFFYQDYNGGTQYTTAAVRRWELVAGARWAPGAVGTLDLSLSGHLLEFFQDRARIINNRSQEFLAGRQYVPANDLGASLTWRSKPLSLGGTHELVAGADARWIDGHVEEALYPAAVTPTSVLQRNGGGKQQLYGVFAGDVYDVSPAVQLTAALRYDSWANLDGYRYQEYGPGGSAPTTTRYPDRTDGQLDPRLGLRVRPLDWLTLRGAGYHAFRAPTLDELYRPFQVGTVLTYSNPALGPETLWGWEVGLDVAAAAGLSAGATGFWNELQDPVLNVTCPGPPGIQIDPVTTCTAPNRQKQNLGQARIRGVEAKAAWRFASSWSLGAAWLFVDSRVTDAPGNPQLVGKELPQDPRNRGNLTLAFDDPRLLTVSAQATYTGKQYEDDLNTLPMWEVVLVDLYAAWHATRFLDVYAAVQNVFDVTYLVGRAGVDTVGQPRFIHGGVRVSFGP